MNVLLKPGTLNERTGRLYQRPWVQYKKSPVWHIQRHLDGKPECSFGALAKANRRSPKFVKAIQLLDSNVIPHRACPSCLVVVNRSHPKGLKHHNIE